MATARWSHIDKFFFSVTDQGKHGDGPTVHEFHGEYWDHYSS